MRHAPMSRLSTRIGAEGPRCVFRLMGVWGRSWPVVLPVNRRLLFLGSVLLVLLLSTRVVRLNISPSVPYGLYQLHAVPGQLGYGQLVVAHVPPSISPWHPFWIPLLKPVAGLQGDILTVQEGRFYINGEDFGPVLRDAQGQPLPQISSPRVVQAGEVVLASKAPRSLDGRYTGPVPQRSITALATPLFTWR